MKTERPQAQVDSCMRRWRLLPERKRWREGIPKNKNYSN